MARGPGRGGCGLGPTPPFSWALGHSCWVFSCSHKDTATKIKATAQRALLASHTSYMLLWGLLEGGAALEARQELEDRCGPPGVGWSSVWPPRVDGA